MTDSKSRCVVEISTDTRPIVYLTIHRLSTDYRPTINQPSTDYRPTIDRLLTDYRPSIDRLSIAISTAMSTAMSTDISVDITHSKQDPKMKGAVVLGMTSLVIIFAVFLRSKRSFIQPMRLMSLKIRKMRRSVFAFLLLFCAWNLIRLTRFAFSLFQGSVSSVPPIINATL